MPRMAELLEGLGGTAASLAHAALGAPASRLAAALAAYQHSPHGPAPTPAIHVATTPAGSSGTSFVQEIQNWAVNWQPVFAILFFVVLIFIFWRMLKVMPRVKPQQIKPASDQSVSFADAAGPTSRARRTRRSTSCSSRWTASPRAAGSS